MRKSLPQYLLFAAIIVAGGWLVVDPSPEPLIAVITGLVALLSMRRPGSPPKATPTVARPRSRVAVLPLRNITEVPGREYFADGLTEELISVLSRLGQLQVIAASSTSQYRESPPSIQEVASDLQVGAVLEGSVRSTGTDLRVSIRLVDAETQVALWTCDYDRRLKEVFALQQDIARAVAHALEVTVVGDEARRLNEAPTSDLEAYDLYLLGCHSLAQRSEQGVRKSIERFRAAVAKDPNYAAAHAGIADAYVLATIGYASIPADEAVREARAATDRALAAQETLSDAHTSKGFVLMNFDRDWAGATKEFKRAIELNPSDARAYQWFAQCLSYQGRPQEALPLIQEARVLDPQSPLIATEAGWPYLYMGRHDEAAIEFEHALALDPDFALAHFNLGNVLEARGDVDAALNRYERAASASARAPMFVAFVARALGLLRRTDHALNELRDVEAAVEAGAPLSVYVAHAYEGIGDRDNAVAWLDRAVADDEMLTIAIGSTWLPFQTLRGDERYEQIVRGLPMGTMAKPSPAP